MVHCKKKKKLSANSIPSVFESAKIIKPLSNQANPKDIWKGMYLKLLNIHHLIQTLG